MPGCDRLHAWAARPVPLGSPDPDRSRPAPPGQGPPPCPTRPFVLKDCAWHTWICNADLFYIPCMRRTSARSCPPMGSRQSRATGGLHAVLRLWLYRRNQLWLPRIDSSTSFCMVEMVGSTTMMELRAGSVATGKPLPTDQTGCGLALLGISHLSTSVGGGGGGLCRVWWERSVSK